MIRVQDNSALEKCTSLSCSPVFPSGSQAIPRSAQAEGVHPTHCVPEEQAQVCSHWGRGEAHSEPATHQD